MSLLRFPTIVKTLIYKMSTLTSESLVPIGVRGMTILDREKFTREVTIPTLKISEEILSKTIQVCKPYLLKMENFKPVQNCESNAEPLHQKLIHLNPEKVIQWSDISDEARETLTKHGADPSNFMPRNIQLSYDNWRIEQIFKSVLPENEEIVSGFSQIGHIIHLNLKDHLLNYKYLIGQVLVDKIKTCRTVINKCNTINNTYRNFSMEILAGEEDYLVTVKENRCNFQFDFSKVYWNPRLGKEHERILSFMKPNDILFDVFCGVGPFSVPAVKKKCKVYANDLNPDSYKWLTYNAKANKVTTELFKAYNLDGKEFIQSVFKNYLLEYCKGNEVLGEGSQIHVTMNLPALAVEFLQYFNGLIPEKDLIDKLDCNIVVYVYCFVIGEDPTTLSNVAKEMVNKNIGCNISDYITSVFEVRNVSPKKQMMRVTFNLPKDLLFGELVCEPPNKKVCLDIVS